MNLEMLAKEYGAAFGEFPVYTSFASGLGAFGIAFFIFFLVTEKRISKNALLAIALNAILFRMLFDNS